MKLDIDNIDPKDLEKLLNRRNHSFAIHTRKTFADAWRIAAHAEGLMLREWVENVLNNAAEKTIKKLDATVTNALKKKR